MVLVTPTPLGLLVSYPDDNARTTYSVDVKKAKILTYPWIKTARGKNTFS